MANNGPTHHMRRVGVYDEGLLHGGRSLVRRETSHTHKYNKSNTTQHTTQHCRGTSAPRTTRVELECTPNAYCTIGGREIKPHAQTQQEQHHTTRDTTLQGHVSRKNPSMAPRTTRVELVYAEGLMHDRTSAVSSLRVE